MVCFWPNNWIILCYAHIYALASHSDGIISYATFIFMFLSDGKSISTHTLYVVIAGISLVTVLLLLVVSILLCKSKRGGGYGRKPKGYMAAATSPRGKGGKNELNPPDLWIHHDQMLELKAIEKNQRDGTDQALVSTPISRNFPDPCTLSDDCLLDKSRMTASSYVSDSLYDDVSKGPSSPTDNGLSYVSGTNTARRTVRAKPIMIPVDTGMQGVGSMNFEPSTGLSRPVYPRTQLNHLSRGHLSMDCHDGIQSNQLHHLYDPVSSSPLQMGHGGQLSNNISYSTGITANEQLIASPNTNTLSKRGGGHQHALKSFVPAGPLKNSANQPKHSIGKHRLQRLQRLKKCRDSTAMYMY